MFVFVQMSGQSAYTVGLVRREEINSYWENEVRIEKEGSGKERFANVETRHGECGS